MARFTLHYGGQKFPLADNTGPLFDMKVNKALVDGEVQLLEATLETGAILKVAVSPSIPIAIEYPNPNKQSPIGGRVH